KIARLLYEDLKKVNIIPILTRTEDKLYKNSRIKDIKRRPQIANENNADLFISIHCNNFPNGQPSGSQIFYKFGSNKSKELAEYLQKELITIREENNRSLKNGDYYVLNKIKNPGVLIEVGFLSNPEDRRVLTDEIYQKKISEAIKNGVVKYFQSKFRDIQSDNKDNTERNNEKEKAVSRNDINSVFYLSTVGNELHLIKNQLIFPTANFFDKKNSVLSFNEILALSALEQLMEPPAGLISPLPAETRILSVNIKDNILTINLSKETAQNFNGGSNMEEKSVTAIVRTLQSISGVKGVKILINDKAEKSLGGHIIFDGIIY
ncbi:MAG: N-acetylmuramoyl-L-alanine amidase, partial [Bacillota bacterium]